MRSFFGSIFVILGCATAMIVVTAIITSMQLDDGIGLLIAVGALSGAALSLALGFFILVYRR